MNKHRLPGWQELAKRRVALGKANDECCARCGLPISYDLPGTDRLGPTADHVIPLAYGGDILPPISELAVMHKRCNSQGGAAITNSRRRRKSVSSSPETGGTDFSQGLGHPARSEEDTPATPKDLGKVAVDPRGTPEDWARFDVPWLKDLFPPPANVAWPRHMTAVHPRAVDSLGPEAERWAKDNLGLTLRWWQRLAMRRQLEVDEDGNLVWFTVIESTPRRSGKSTRIRATALWRQHQAKRFGEPQTVMLTGKDLPVIKEIHRRAWPWAESQGYDIRKQNGNEELELPDTSRWLIRSTAGVYGYDVGLGIVDEAWGVAPMAVDDGLEPALLERSNPQLLLTSTGHPKATALMTIRRDAALEQLHEPHDTLLLDWGAPDDAAVGDRVAWRAASPHWTAERERLLESALRRLMTGKDVDADGLDPEVSFAAQYLNRWVSKEVRTNRWLPEDLVAACSVPSVTMGEWRIAAVEVAMDGMQWSAALSDGRNVSAIVGVPLSSVLEWVSAQGAMEVCCHQAVASRLPTDWNTHYVTTGEASAAAQALAEAIRGGEVVWDAGERLAVQAARVVTVPGPAGPRIGDRLSHGPVEAIKAVSWAYWRATSERMEMAAIW